MTNKLYVGKLPYSMTSEDLKALFVEKMGEDTVEDAAVIPDRENPDRANRGFGFVTMKTEELAEAAIAALNEYEVNGQILQVNEARPQAPRSDRPAYNGNGGGSRGGSSYGGGRDGGRRY